jgi:hypothetical protein
MLKKYYSRKEVEAKKDGGDGDTGGGERLPHRWGTDGGHVQQPTQAGAA